MPVSRMGVLAVIPARWGSSRFPGKPLALIAGKPMVQWVWEKAKQARLVTEVIIATDDERIARAAAGFGAKVEMTSPELSSGTDRVAKVAERFGDMQVVLNVQGDEPLILPEILDAVAQPLLEDTDLPIATAVTPMTEPDDFQNPNVVKVVLNRAQNALYFSRAPIPFFRHGFEKGRGQMTPYRHLGIYGYQRTALLALASLEPSLLEKAEELEQLRFLEAGYTIRCVETRPSGPGVDCPEDIAKIEALINAG